MPFYEFYCDHPDSPYKNKPLILYWTMERYMRDKDTQLCPETGFPMYPKICTSSFKFKGSGFYSTDYKGKP